MGTRVVGCKFLFADLCFVRIETALISVAFDSAENVILYTRCVDNEVIEGDKRILKTVLGPLFQEESFGIHCLRGGPFEVLIPQQNKVIDDLRVRAHPCLKISQGEE